MVADDEKQSCEQKEEKTSHQAIFKAAKGGIFSFDFSTALRLLSIGPKTRLTRKLKTGKVFLFLKNFELKKQLLHL